MAGDGPEVARKERNWNRPFLRWWKEEGGVEDIVGNILPLLYITLQGWKVVVEGGI
jgi:hypothetical protein